MRWLLLNLILLFGISHVSAQTIPTASGVTVTKTPPATFYTFKFPGYAQITFGDGLPQSSTYDCIVACNGIAGYWDLKNDPNALSNFAPTVPMILHQFWINNADASSRYDDSGDPPGVVTITESNNVRVILTSVGQFREYNIFHPPDCCITVTKTHVFYRHGGAGTGLGALKVYTNTSMNYDGTDGKGPLSITSMRLINAIDSEQESKVIAPPNVNNPCHMYYLYTVMPWNIIWQGPGSQTNKDYMLFAPVAANSTNAGEFFPANPCVSPSGSFTGPEGASGQPAPGTVYICNGATLTGCTSQTVSPVSIKAGFMLIDQRQITNSYVNIGTDFLGYVRTRADYTGLPYVLNTNSPVVFKTLALMGDNGIISEATANPYVTEYKTPPTMTPTNATGGAFDNINGYWTLARTSDNVSISASGPLHSPAWYISNWSSTAAGLTVGGVTKTLNTDFVLAKPDSTHLLIQYLTDVPSSTVVVFSPASQSPSIAPLLPAVNQGATQLFTASDAGTWACSGTDSSGNPTTCAGSIVAGTGVYTAPATVNAQQSYGGFQLLPNNHVFNTRIDSLPVDTTHGTTLTINSAPTGATRTSNVATITTSAATSGMGYQVGETVIVAGVTDSTFNGTFTITTLPGGCSNLCFTYANPGSNTTSGGGTVLITWNAYFQAITNISQNYVQNIPVNYVDYTTWTPTMGFQFTSVVNGPFQIPNWPALRAQAGWLNSPNYSDHHFITVDTGIGYQTSLTTLVTGMFTNGGMFQELYNLTADTNHACLTTCAAVSGVRYSNSTYDLDPGGSIDTTAAGNLITPLHLHLQEMEEALLNSTTINHAVTWTLSNSYLCGSSTAGACGQPGGTRHVWPATAESFSGGGVLPYGVRFRLKSSFNISTFSPIAQILLTQLKQYGVFLTDGGIGMQTGVELTRWPKSYFIGASVVGATKEIQNALITPSNFEAVDESSLQVSSSSGKTPRNREIITFTRTSDSATASTDVVLTGVTVNMANDVLNVQAGAPALQLVAYAHGANDTSLTWSMNPSIGALNTSTGVYTPPATIGSVTTVTVTATSVANSAVSAFMTMTVFPVGGIRLIPGKQVPYAPDNNTYTDSGGNVWVPYVGFDSGDIYNTGASSPPWPNTTDISLYYYQFNTNIGDSRFDFWVPNGSYTVTAKCGALFGAGQWTTFELNGTIFYPDTDVFVAAGGNNLPSDFRMSTVVTNNQLSFVLRMPQNHNGGTGQNTPDLDAISIVPGITDITLSPGVKIVPGVSVQ
jgi:hypothetical protein